MIEIDVRRGEASMAKQALDLLQRIAEQPTVGCPGEILILVRLAGTFDELAGPSMCTAKLCRS